VIVDTISIPTGSSVLEWAPTQDVLALNNGGALWTLDLDTAEVEKLVSVGKYGCWSHDDSRIVYFTDVSGAAIKTVDLKRGRIKTLAYYGTQPDWRR
jgi:hypothetical protein